MNNGYIWTWMIPLHWSWQNRKEQWLLISYWLGFWMGNFWPTIWGKQMWLYSKCHSPKSWLVKNGIPNSWWESSICCDFRLGEFNRQNNHQPMCWTLLVKWCVNGRKTSKNEQDLVAEIIKMQKEVQEYWQGVERQRWEIWHDNRDYIVVYNQPNELILKTT